MSNKLIKIASLSLLSLSLVACQDNKVTQVANESSIEATVESTFTLELNDGKSTTIHAVAIEETLMDSLKSSFDVSEEGGFIGSVGELVANPDNKEFLSIYINGEMAMTGADKIKLEQGDTATITLETWE